VNHYARVLDIREVFRWQLFPDQPRDGKGQRRYYQLLLSPLQRLPRPIFSRRWRRILFMRTTWGKFTSAAEIDEVWDESPLEDRLWAGLKRRAIDVERQEFVQVKGHTYSLHFAIYCDRGRIDVETDGDRWHADRQRIPLDNMRDNDLETAGWRVLRFNTHHIREEMDEVCVPTIVGHINGLGGLSARGLVPREIWLDVPEGTRQLSLFEADVDDDLD
jgi:very-short-patch-repair endonuclease